MGSVSQQRSEEAPSVGRRQQKGELMCLITYNTHACGPWHGKISSFMARARPSKSARGLSLRSFSCPIIAVVGRQATTNASFAPRRVDVPFHRIIPTPTTPSGVRSSPLMAAEVGVRRAEQREGPGQARVHVLFGRFASLDVIINPSVAPPSCRQRQAGRPSAAMTAGTGMPAAAAATAAAAASSIACRSASLDVIIIIASSQLIVLHLPLPSVTVPSLRPGRQARSGRHLYKQQYSHHQQQQQQQQQRPAQIEVTHSLTNLLSPFPSSPPTYYSYRQIETPRLPSSSSSFSPGMANRPNARAASDTQRAAPDPENSVEFCVKVSEGEENEGG